jgi:hypothetical protein
MAEHLPTQLELTASGCIMCAGNVAELPLTMYEMEGRDRVEFPFTVRVGRFAPPSCEKK